MVFFRSSCHSRVSSLYGRVYRGYATLDARRDCFLPVWEGVSPLFQVLLLWPPFPPCMGGCIEEEICELMKAGVSSLYGRVYRPSHEYEVCFFGFLPVWEGVSLRSEVSPLCSLPHRYVSSLYGRVYHTSQFCQPPFYRFLPVWEGVSLFLRAV